MPRARKHRYRFTEKALERQIKDYFNRVASLGDDVPTREKHYDSDCPNLALFLEATGGKNYKFKYVKPTGKTAFEQINEYGAITPEQARNIAKEWEANRIGGKPFGIQKRSHEDNITLKEFFEKFYLPHIKNEIRTWARQEYNFNEYLEKLHDIPILDLTSKNILSVLLPIRDGIAEDNKDESGKLHKEKTGKPTYMNLRSLISSIFKYSKTAIGNPNDNPITSTSVPRYKPKEREVIWTNAEREAFLAAVAKEKEPWKSIWMLLYLTGLRRFNMLALEWSEIHWEIRKIIIPGEKFKNKEKYCLQMSEPVFQILSKLKENATSNIWVFPSKTSQTGHIIDTKKATRRMRKLSGLPADKLYFHGMRHVCASEYANKGVSLYDMMDIFGWKDVQLPKRYGKNRPDRLSEIVNKMGNIMGNMAQTSPE